jgi:Rhodopirellula transposase DDE domain
MRGLRWTCKSTRKLAKELATHGHAVSHTTVAEELHLQQYKPPGESQDAGGSLPSQQFPASKKGQE